MKKLIITSLFATCFVMNNVNAQENYSNIEDFKDGTILVFQNCDTDTFEIDNVGKNVIWDYSNLKNLDETTTQWIVSPKGINEAKDYPEATLVEKYSDGKYVFLKADKNKTYLLGFVDEKSKIKIKYPQPVLIANRPFSYNEKISETYTTSYTVSGMDFSGKGTVTIEADGFGTLILPNKTYTNTLRIKITQNQTDTLKQYNSISNTTLVTYVWFDTIHTSALLKMTETKSQYHSEKSIQYLLSETQK